MSEIDVYSRIISRWDAWAKQATLPDGNERFPYLKQNTPITPDLLKKSIDSDMVTIGTYCIDNQTNTVKNPLIDVDNHDGKTDVKTDVVRVYEYLLQKGAHPYIEASGGRIEDGAHVGIICKPTHAAKAKSFLEVALKALGLQHEVFPKQTKVNKSGFGNLIKLPFQYNNRTKARSVIINPASLQPMPKEIAVEYMINLPETVISSETEKETKCEGVTCSITGMLSQVGRCFAEAYFSRWDLSGDKGDRFRLYAATELIFARAKDQEIHEYFRIQSDYNSQITQGKIDTRRAAIREKGIKPPKCTTIKEIWNISPALCANCPRKQRRREEQALAEVDLSEVANDPVEKAVSKFRVPGIFELAEEMQQETPVYYDKSKNFWLWNGQYYELIDEIDILTAVRKLVDDEKKVLGYEKNQILDALKITGRERRVKGVPKSWIHLQDTIVDIATGERIEPNPGYLLTAPIPHKIGLSTETPTIDRLFKEWVGVDKMQLLYEICAYCLVDDYPIHRLFLLFGRGRNGKGQFKIIIQRLVGECNVTATTLEALVRSRFESARLYKKKVAAIGETNSALLEDTVLLKMLTGGDEIPAEFKNKNPFTFYNTAKIIINTNSLPPTTDKTDGFYSRWVQITFPNQFLKSKDIVDTIPDCEYDNLVAKCIEVLKELLAKGEFTGEGTIQEKASNYEALSNPLIRFIEEECVKDKTALTPLWHVQEQFKEYSKLRGFRVCTDVAIRKQLENEGYELEPNHVFHEFEKNGQWTGVVGLLLKNNPYLPRKNEPFSETVQTVQTDQPAYGDTDFGAFGAFGVLPFSPVYKELSETSPNTPNTPNLHQLLEIKAKEWEQTQGENISSLNLTKATFDLKLHFPETSADEIINFLRKYAKITPASKGDVSTLPVTVRFLKDVPVFSEYVDMKNYEPRGPFKPGDIITISQVSAQVLIKSKAAEMVNVGMQA